MTESSLILGGDGLLGRHLKRVFPLARALGKQQCSIVHPVMLEPVLDGADLVVNCASMTNVDNCEQMAGEAFRVNALGAYMVGRACRKLCVPLLHISTDMVYGKWPAPFVDGWDPGLEPNHLEHAVNIYGESKALAEWLLVETQTVDWIVRTANLYGRGGRNWASRVLLNLQAGQVVRADCERELQPTWAMAVAKSMRHILDLTLGVGPHFRHVVAATSCTWYDWCLEMCRLGGFSTSLVKPVRSAEVGYRAARTTKLLLADSETKQSWQSMLEDYLIDEIGHLRVEA